MFQNLALLLKHSASWRGKKNNKLIKEEKGDVRKK
jgi:hypothetical protein